MSDTNGMQLEDVVPGQRISGLTARTVTVVSTAWIGGDYLQVTYRGDDGSLGEGLVDRTNEAGLALDTGEGERAFAADAAQWKVGAEALRIRHAALIDPMLAVSSSTLQPLPHQIKAVYGEFLPRTPLRYLLADDPGAGKTIMCGLYIKELILRGDLDRCLIVAPGGLVDQWQDELWEKFGLQFRVLTRDLVNTTVGTSVFDEHPLLIARMDMLARDEALQEQLDRSDWDLVVVDEAHRMSAKYTGGELDATQRYALGRRLGHLTRNLLLMTATPHAGDPSAFQAFLALLDEDRFVGEAKQSVAPGTDLMRRMLKEELLTMEGRPLFPERRASTVSYTLTHPERRLYDAVSDYVRDEMNRVERLQSEGERSRAATVGFALTVLQRRLASSPEAILRSLERRRARLAARRDELAKVGTDAVRADPTLSQVTVPGDDDEAWVERPAAEAEEAEEELVDAASAARTMAELDVEIAVLDELVEIAVDVRSRDTDSKWSQLRTILEDDAATRDHQGAPRKIIVFTEHRDTLSYLSERIQALPGRGAAVVEIHGGMPRGQRRAVQDRFTRDPATTVLVATDAAGEGLNLQAAHLMVNYDLPWNPNRIEQRFGRIHRIGQTEVCHLWNLVAEGTREGDVFLRLLAKMEEQSKAYRGKVFDVLGEAFEGDPLHGLLVRAVRYGDDPKVRQQLHTVIDDKVGDGLPELVERRALYQQVLQQVDVGEAQERVDLGVRTRLQPHFAAPWFQAAFKAIGGRVRRRGEGVQEIPVVPEAVRRSARQAGVSLPNSYSAVTFDPDVAADAASSSPVQVLGPGHPLLDTVADVTTAKQGGLLREGALLIDPNDEGSVPRLLCAVSHEVTDGHSEPHSLSRRFAFVEIAESGAARDVGAAYLDYRGVEPSEEAAAGGAAAASPFVDGGERAGRDWALRHLVPDHVDSVRESHATVVERSRAEITERLTAEIDHWRTLAERRAGDDQGESTGAAHRRVAALEARLQQRLAELDADAHIVARPPHVHACALVVPAGALGPRGAHPGPDPSATDEAVRLVESVESSAGRAVLDVRVDGRPVIRSRDGDGMSLWIDIRVPPRTGRAVVFSRTEVLHAKNLQHRHRLALVDVSGHAGGPGEVRYVEDAFRRVRVDDFHQHEFEVPWSTLWRSGTAVTRT